MNRRFRAAVAQATAAALAVAVALAVAASLTAVIAPASASARGPVQAVGIRLVQERPGRVANPRAKLYVVARVAPGKSITRYVDVVNQTPAAQAIRLYAAGATISGGAFRFGPGRATNELTRWTTVGPTDVRTASGDTRRAKVTIDVPTDASPGERYEVIWAELPPSKGSSEGITEINRVGVRVYLLVGGHNAPAGDFAIASMKAGRDADGDATVTALVRNTGGRAVDLSGELTLANGPGGLAGGPFPVTLGTTLGVGQTESVVVPLSRAIPAGHWDAHLVLRSGLTMRDADDRILVPAPLAPRSDGGIGWFIPAAAGVAVLLVVFVLVRLWRRGRVSTGTRASA